MNSSQKTDNFLRRMSFVLIHAALIMLISAYTVMLFADASSWRGYLSLFRALFFTYNPQSYTVLAGGGIVMGWTFLLLYGATSLLRSFYFLPESERTQHLLAGQIGGVIVPILTFLVLMFFSDSRAVVQVVTFPAFIATLLIYAGFLKFSPERVRAASDFIVSIFIVLLLFFTVNIYARRTNKIKDVSSSQFYSLSEATTRMVGGLKKNVKVYVILTGSRLRQGLIKDYTDKLFTQIDSISEKITIEKVPPGSPKAKTLLKKYNIRSAEAWIFECGEKNKAIPITPAGDPLAVFKNANTHHPGMNRSIREIEAYKGEHILFLTINEITSDRKKEILFIEGHGERSVTSHDRSNLTDLSKELTKLNYTVLTKKLQQGEVPVADAIVIAAPETTFLDWEVESLRRYLKETNGSLIYFAEPIIGDSWVSEAGLAPLMKEYGIELHNAVGLWYSKKFKHFFDEVKTSLYEVHPVTKSFTNEEVSFKTARPLGKADFSEPAMKTIMLVTKSPGLDQELWGETRFGRKVRGAGRDEKDIMPPLDMVAVSGPKKVGGDYLKTPRVIAVGDVDIITNQNFQNLNNSRFILNCFNWSLEQSQVEKIPPKDFEFIKVEVRDDVMSGILYLIVISVPGFLLIFGLIVLIRRRS